MTKWKTLETTWTHDDPSYSTNLKMKNSCSSCKRPGDNNEYYITTNSPSEQPIQSKQQPKQKKYSLTFSLSANVMQSSGDTTENYTWRATGPTPPLLFGVY